MQKTEQQIVYWLGLIVTGLIWGSNFILIKKGLIAFSPTEVSCLRMTIAFVAFLPIIIVKSKLLKRQDVVWYLLVTIIGSVIPAFLFSFAQQKVNSSIAGTLNSLIPLFTFFIGILFFRIEFSLNALIGVLVGLFGALLLIYNSNQTITLDNLQYSFLIVLATILYGLSINIVQNKLSRRDPFLLSAMAFLFMGLPSSIYLMTIGTFSKISNQPKVLQSFLYISVLAVLGSFVATLLYYWLIVKTSALFASMFGYIIPICATFWGFIDGENISKIQILCIAIILAGVYLTNSTRIKITNG